MILYINMEDNFQSNIYSIIVLISFLKCLSGNGICAYQILTFRNNSFLQNVCQTLCILNEEKQYQTKILLWNCFYIFFF